MKRALSAVSSTISANMKLVWTLLKESFLAWLEDDAPSMGAALTFYATLSLAPVLIVATAIAGLGFGQELAAAEVSRHLQVLVGETSAKAIESAILSANQPALGVIASVIGVGTMLLGATGAFVELQNALNTIWRVKRKSGSLLSSAIRQRFLSFSLVLSTGVLLLLVLISSATLRSAERFMGLMLPWRVFLFDSILSFAVIALLLALIFKFLPDTQIAWNDVWIGAGIASLLLTTGKVLIGLYLSRSVVSSAYGAVSSPLVVLVWIYYSAQLLLFGAEMTHVYARKHGSRR